MASNNYFFFLNRRNSGDGFRESINGKYFVDKSLLIDSLNSKISTKEKWICVSRPRRFGKTMNLEMLSAYYTKGIQSDDLFRGLKIKEKLSYYQHLNNHNVICMNFSEFFDNEKSASYGIEMLSDRLKKDLDKAFPETIDERAELSLCLDMVEQSTGEKFIFLIDEWDSLLRLRKGKKQEQEEFLNFLRVLFKDKSYVELVYMTGILPIKKYNTGSALNMFREFTMLEPKKLAAFFGFSQAEVERLCKLNGEMSAEELKAWYNGYHMPGVGAVYNPCSVVEALGENVCRDYWNRTGGYSELEEYITKDFYGLGDTVVNLVAGEAQTVDVLGFSNDLDSFHDKDEVLTALVHLGYLTYENGLVKIPNKEIQEEFVNTVKKLSWGTVTKLLIQSRELLTATIRQDADKVAQMLEDAHDSMQEFKEYSNEHTLKCVIHLAYYAAVDDYEMKYEAVAGKGYADCIMIPRKPNKPGMILELKYDKSAVEAIKQIRKRNYLMALEGKCREVLLVGVSYDKNLKKHECIIEKEEL